MTQEESTRTPPPGIRELPWTLEDARLRELGPRLARLRSAGEGALDVEAMYGLLIRNLPGVVYLDPAYEELDSIYVSPQVEDLLGVTPEQWLSDPYCWASHVHPDDYDRVWDEYTDTIAKGLPLAREYRMIHADGTVKTVFEQAYVIPDAQGRPFLVQGVILDVTDRRNADELQFLAYHDPLTGLANRSLFEEMLTMSVAKARRSGGTTALLFVDLDNFKQVNDTMGHHVGDVLLQRLAERLRPCVRDADVVARRSGDEFLALLDGLDANPDHAVLAARAVAERMRAALEEPFDLEGTPYVASASIGISLYPHDAADVASLLKRADDAMYASKRSSRPITVAYGAGAQQEADEARSLSARIHQAVRDEAWTLHWLPMVDLQRGGIVGAEALIRWHDVNGGIVPPGEFLPVAEELGLIEAIGGWVVEELCREDARWRDAGHHLKLGFNLSPRQLWSLHLSEKLIGRLRDGGVPPSRVILDIAESTAMADPERAQRVIVELRAWGLGLAIDDFGAGHSSLSRLASFMVDYLKIDRQFVRGVDVDLEQAAVVRAIVTLADSLGVTPVAVGVETEGEAAFLRSLGVPLAQGYLFGRPMPAEDLTAALGGTVAPAR
ncbi:MAG: putative bifunctional diguanylate cyclase/phosphodiesterase [Planctomycetaceae bacterium]